MPSSPPSSSDEFDEDLYLEKNPDVRDAILRGDFASGFSHYMAFGYRENRGGSPGWDPELKLAADFDQPLPPAHLRMRVHGDDGVHGFGLGTTA